MRSFLEGAISPEDFQSQYLAKFKNETEVLDEWTYQILDRLFGDVDAFCVDELLLRRLEGESPGWYLTDAQLRERVQDALDRLRDETDDPVQR